MILLEYPIEVWDPHTNKLIDQLELVQNRALSFILNIWGAYSLTEARDKLKLEENSRFTLLAKMLADDCHNHESLVSSFTDILNSKHDQGTSLSQSSVPLTLRFNHNPVYLSFLSHTTRDMRPGANSPSLIGDLWALPRYRWWWLFLFKLLFIVIESISLLK